MAFNLNDPHSFWSAKQGTWTQTDFGTAGGLGGKGAALPQLDRWITNVNATGTGLYRYMECTKTKITISVYPIAFQPLQNLVPTSANMRAPIQGVTRMIFRKTTQADDIPFGVKPSLTLNADQSSRCPFTTSGDIYPNVNGGTPKGCTQTLKYSFKNLNRGTARATMNHSYLNAAPTEKDHAYMMLLPTNRNWNEGGLVSPINMCGKFRVVIKVEATLKLSEPNTHTFEGEGFAQTTTEVVQS